MTNPLSGYGISDRDYGAAIGTMVGEAGLEGVKGMAAVADVLANRVQNQAYQGYGDSIEDQAKAGDGSQFNAWSQSPRTIGAYRQAVIAERAATDPGFAKTLAPSLQKQIAQAAEAAYGVFGSRELRGITQGATRYANKAVTDQWATSGPQNKLEGQYGKLQIGNHTFTGPGFLGNAPFGDINAAVDRNWTALQNSYNTPSELNAMDRNMAANRASFGSGTDWGAPVWDGTSSSLNTLAAPLGAVSFGGSLPDITPQPSPTIASDSTGGISGMQTAGGFGGSGFETGGGFGMDASPYGFSSMQPSTAMQSVQNDLSRQYAQSVPSGFDMSPTPQTASVSPYGFSGANVGSVGDFGTFNSASPLGGPLNTVGVNPRIGDANLTGLQANTLGYPDMSLAPAASLPQSASIQPATETPTVGQDFTVSLPPDVPAIPFAQPTVAAPVPPAAPKVVSPTTPAPRAVAPRAPRLSASSSGSAEPSAAAPPASVPDFSTAFNNLYASPTGQAQFQSKSGLNNQTLNALRNAYDNAGMLTGVAYNALQDAFNTYAPSFAQAPVSQPSAPSFSAAAPATSSSPDIGSWGQANNVTGDYGKDTSMASANARIASMGNTFLDPLTGQTMTTGNNGNMNVDSRGGIVGSYSPGTGGLYGGSINDLTQQSWTDNINGKNIGTGLGTVAGTIGAGPLGGALGGWLGGYLGNQFDGWGNSNQRDARDPTGSLW